MQKKEYLLNISKTKAQKLFKSGVIFQQIIRAKSNSRRIKNKMDTHYINEFKNALDGLVNILEN